MSKAILFVLSALLVLSVEAFARTTTKYKPVNGKRYRVVNIKRQHTKKSGRSIASVSKAKSMKSKAAKKKRSR